MTVRPVFVSLPDFPYVEIINIEFEWFPGFAISQKQKSIKALHESARRLRPDLKILEISTKSDSVQGSGLSAFNLKIKLNSGLKIFMESAFQGSKYYSDIGQDESIYMMDPRDAKRIARERNDNFKLQKFVFQGREFPLEPKTIFYDWLYMQCVLTSMGDFSPLLKYNAYTDIEFNPNKSINCQAYSLAMLSSLMIHHDPLEILDITTEMFKKYYINNNLTNSQTKWITND